MVLSLLLSWSNVMIFAQKASQARAKPTFGGAQESQTSLIGKRSPKANSKEL